MQPKRIIISLLVVILALLSVGTVVSAEDSPALDIAVEVSSSSTALSDNLCIGAIGDVVTVSVTIKNNPGICGVHFDVRFDDDYLKPLINQDGSVKWTSSGIFGSSMEEIVTVDYVKGIVSYTAYNLSENLTATGTVFTCSFNVLKHGTTNLRVDMDRKDASYIKEDGKMSEEGIKVNLSHNGNAAVTNIPVMIHTLTDSYTTEPANCTRGGQKIYTCTECNEKIAVDDGTPALGHTEVPIPSVPVTCMQDGLTEGKKCSVCGVVTQKQLVAVEKSDEHHTVVTDAAVAPTCSKVGYTEGSHCSTCNKVFVQQNEIEKIAHTYGDWAPAEKGYHTKTCSVCGEQLTEATSGSSALLLIIITAVVTGVVVAGAAVVTVIVLKKKKVV